MGLWHFYKVRYFKNLFFQDKKVRESVKEKVAYLSSTKKDESLGLTWYRLRLVRNLSLDFLQLLLLPLLSCRHCQEPHRSWEQNALLQKPEEQFRISCQPDDRNSLYSTGKRENEAGRRKWKSLSPVWLFVSPWTIQSTKFSRPEYWSGSLFLLQRIFSTQRSNPGLRHCRQILYQLSHKGRP